jgi:hypothetical protein
MKIVHKKIFAISGLAAVSFTVLVGCATQTLEQQIAVKEPGAWDFKSIDLRLSGGYRYTRLYDKPGKVGWEVMEYGQKHPCNQGFTEAVKTTTLGFVRYESANTKSFACDIKMAYVFRTDENGKPYEGWYFAIPLKEQRKFVDINNFTKWNDKEKYPADYKLVN